MGLGMPGVSRNVTCPSGVVTIPRTTCRVVCGLSWTMDTFSPTRRFKRVDLPELGRPIIETKPDFTFLWGPAFSGAGAGLDGGRHPEFRFPQPRARFFSPAGRVFRQL